MDVMKSMSQGEKRKSRESPARQSKEVKRELEEAIVIVDSDDDLANGSTPNSKTPAPSSASSATDASKAAVIYSIFCRIFSSKPLSRFSKLIHPPRAADQGRFSGGVRLLLHSTAARRNREPRKPPS
jgi:hypothetical protein